MQTQGHQARVLKKNRERILRNQERVAPKNAAGVREKGAFRVPKPQMGRCLPKRR